MTGLDGDDRKDDVDIWTVVIYYPQQTVTLPYLGLTRRTTSLTWTLPPLPHHYYPLCGFTPYHTLQTLFPHLPDGLICLIPDSGLLASRYYLTPYTPYLATVVTYRT